MNENNRLEVDAGLVIDNLLNEITSLHKDKAVLMSQVKQLMDLVVELKDEIEGLKA